MNRHKLNCILLHGWGTNRSVWDNLIDRLKVFNHIDAICLYTTAEEIKANKVEDLAIYLKSKIENDTVIIAWSFGGLVATRIATLTDKIKGIVYIASSPCFLNKSDWENVLDKRSILNLQYNLLSHPKKTIDYFSKLIVQNKQDTKRLRAKKKLSVADEKHSSILFTWLNELVEIDQRKEFSALRLPIQYLIAEQDVLISSGIAKQLKELQPQMICEIIKNGSHASFFDHPQEVLNMINRFISAQIE